MAKIYFKIFNISNFFFNKSGPSCPPSDAAGTARVLHALRLFCSKELCQVGSQPDQQINVTTETVTSRCPKGRVESNQWSVT